MKLLTLGNVKDIFAKHGGNELASCVSRDLLHEKFETKEPEDVSLLNAYLNHLVSHNRLNLVPGENHLFTLYHGPFTMYAIHAKKINAFGEPEEFFVESKEVEQKDVPTERENGFAVSLNMAKKVAKQTYRKRHDKVVDMIDALEIA